MLRRVRLPFVWRSLLSMLAVLTFAIAGQFGETRGARAVGSGSDAYRNGVAAAAVGHFADAARDFEQAVLHGHNDPDTFYRLGLAYSKLKRWNDAEWALASALSDDIFAAGHPEALKALQAAQNAGGTNVGPPSILQGVSVRYSKPAQANPRLLAVRESQAAYKALQDGAYFVAPSFNRVVTYATAGQLSQTAQNLQNGSDTIVKFAYLGATPDPYTDLASYARDLFSHLALQRAVLVVITPGTAAAYSDRLDTATTGNLVAAQLRGQGQHDPITLATGIAQSIVARADADDSANTTRSVLIGGGVLAVILAAVALAVARVARREPVSRMGTAQGRIRAASKSRVR